MGKYAARSMAGMVDRLDALTATVGRLEAALSGLSGRVVALDAVVAELRSGKAAGVGGGTA